VGSFEAAFRRPDCLDRPGLDWIGKTFDLLSAEVAQLEKCAQQATGRSSNDDASGFSQVL
jgi:hypothetical protein